MSDDPRRRFLLVLAVGLIPWTAVSTRGVTTLLHPLGLVNYVAVPFVTIAAVAVAWYVR